LSASRSFIRPAIAVSTSNAGMAMRSADTFMRLKLSRGRNSWKPSWVRYILRPSKMVWL